MTVPRIEQPIADPEGESWIRKTREIPVGKRFELQLCVCFNDYFEPYQDPELLDYEKDEMQFKWQKELRLLMMPRSLKLGTIADTPANLGLLT